MHDPRMQIPVALALLAATVSAVTDVGTRRIPNWLTGGTLLLGLIVNTLTGGWSGLALAGAGAALGLALLLPFFAMNVMGAGDVKLLAALGAVVGPRELISVALYAAVAGGVLSAIILARQGRLMVTLEEIVVRRVPPTRGGAKAPYAVAIAAGVYCSMLLPAVVT